jgi:hypothetical protein
MDQNQYNAHLDQFRLLTIIILLLSYIIPENIIKRQKKKKRRKSPKIELNILVGVVKRKLKRRSAGIKMLPGWIVSSSRSPQPREGDLFAATFFLCEFTLEIGSDLLVPGLQAGVVVITAFAATILHLHEEEPALVIVHHLQE